MVQGVSGISNDTDDCYTQDMPISRQDMDAIDQFVDAIWLESGLSKNIRLKPVG